MTIIEAPNLYDAVDAPDHGPYRFGLFSLPEFNVGGDRDGFGLTWRSEACAETGITYDVCLDPAVADLTSTTVACVEPQFDPFVVYAYLTDSMIVEAGSDDADLARTRFLNVEQYAVEKALEARLSAAVAPVAVLGTGEFSVRQALAQVEQALAVTVKGRGVIHMSRFAATLLADRLKVEGGQLRTALGTPVVAGGGYATDALPTAVTVYGTGPMVARRSGIEVVSAPRYDINSMSEIAQRTYVIGWDCGAVGATATL